MSQQNMDKTEKGALSTRFRVVISGMSPVTFSSCEGIESAIDVQTYAEIGGNSGFRTGRGLPITNQISFGQGEFEKGSGIRNDIHKWYQEVCDPSKKLAKKNMKIVLLDSEEKKLAEWEVLRAWPCAWKGPLLNAMFNSMTVEYLRFAHEGIQSKE